MTQYDGYDYGFDAFLTTALDITEPGGAVRLYVVRDVCGAVPLGRAVARPMQRRTKQPSVWDLARGA